MRKLIWFFCLLPVFSVFAQENNLPLRLDLSAQFKAKGEYGEAIRVLEEISPQSPQAKAFLAKLYYLSGDSRAAINILNGVEKKDWQGYLYLGLAYEDENMAAKAANAFARSCQLKKNSLAFYRLAKIFYQRKDFYRAAEYFSQTISADPSVRLANYYLGDCRLVLGKYEEAYRYLAKAVNFYPENETIKNKLELAKKRLGDDYFTSQAKDKDVQRRKVVLSEYTPQVSGVIVDVGIAQEIKEFSFKSGGAFTASDGRRFYSGGSAAFYKITLDKGKFILSDYDRGDVFAEFSGQVEIKTKGQNYPFYIFSLTYGKGDYWQKELDRAFRGSLKIFAAGKGMTVVNSLSIEEYLYGVVPGEIIPSWDKEALKAQAVAARTIAVKNINRHKKDGFQLCADVHCQVYQGFLAETPQTNAAVQSTYGEILTYHGQPIETVYHSNCGGCLRSDPFGAKAVYLPTKCDAAKKCREFSPYDLELWFTTTDQESYSRNSSSTYRWQRVFDAEDFALVFGRDISDLAAIKQIKLSDCFHHEEMEVEFTGKKTQLRGDLKIRNYFDALRSSAFNYEIKYFKDKPAMLFFWGAGFGHGGGMSQEGANNMAKQGATYKKILKHYYSGIELTKFYQ